MRVINGHSVRDGGAVDGMLSPEGQRPGGHYVRVVPVGLRYASFGVIAEAVIDGAAGDTPLHDRQQHSGRAQEWRIVSLQVGGLWPTEQLVKQVVEPLFFRHAPRGRGHADDGAGPLLHGPRPAIGGGVVSLVDHHQVVRIVTVPDLVFVGPPTHGLSHENDDPTVHGRGVGSRWPADIRPCRNAGIGQHPTGLLGQLLAVGEPDRLAVIV